MDGLPVKLTNGTDLLYFTVTHQFVILFTGGYASMRAGIPPPPPPPLPPGPDTPPRDHAAPLRPCTHPRDHAHPPPHTPAAEHAGRYGQRAGGTHPTGMQSCVTHKVGITTPVVNSCPVEIDVKS